MTPSQFTAILRAEQRIAGLVIHSGSGTRPHPTGTLPDGRGWILSDKTDTGFAHPGHAMPSRLTLRFYQSETENPQNIPFSEPVAVIPGITAEQALSLVRAAAAGDWNTVTSAAAGENEGYYLAAPDGSPVPVTGTDPASEAMEAVSAIYENATVCLVRRITAHAHLTPAAQAELSAWAARQPYDTIIKLHTILDYTKET